LGEIGKNEQLRLLGDLCRSLAAFGVGVQMRDAVPSLTVSADQAAPASVGVRVLVDASGTEFTWRPDDRHPVSDVEGAARRIAECVQQVHRRASDERSGL
jgi:hypothetical protein